MHILNLPESIDDLELDLTTYQFPPYHQLKKNSIAKPRIIVLDPTPLSPRMQDEIPQVPRRDLLIPKSANPSSLFDTSDEEGIFTPGPDFSSAATSMASSNKKPVYQLSRPQTPKPSMINGGNMPPIPTTPVSMERERLLERERERKRKREQTPMDEAQMQVQTEHRDRLTERRTKSPSPGTLRPIIKKSPKRTNVRFSDMRGASTTMGVANGGGHRRRLSIDAAVQNNGIEKQEESDDTLEEEKPGSNMNSPKSKRRKTPGVSFLDSKFAWVYAGAALLFGIATVKLFAPETIHQPNLTALCHLPGMQGLAESLPFCHQAQPKSQFKYAKGDQAPPDYKRLMELQFSFEKILEDSVGGSRLAYDMKTSEMAVRDLTTLVKVSGLACREQLVVHLDSFGDSARVASRSLSKLSSRVMGTIDSILALDQWAKKTLEDIRDSEIASRNSVSSMVLYRWRDDGQKVRKDVSSIFLKTTEGMDGQLQRLVMEAEGVLRLLDDLENHLVTIHEIVSREVNHVKMENDEVLSAILTKLGANRQRIARNKEHVKLLNNVGHYRKTALSHVSATVVELERMSADLEQLRETVAAPSLLEGVVEVPIELHIRNIDQGIVRLSAGRLKASSRKDEYHQAVIANIDYRNKMVDEQIEEIASKPLAYHNVDI